MQQIIIGYHSLSPTFQFLFFLDFEKQAQWLENMTMSYRIKT